MLNVWRIPLLFFVSGMGVYFAMQHRNWKQLLKERAGRILIPFVFGIFVIVPIHIYLLQSHYQWELSYQPGPGHLWFLGNIFAYVIILSPVFYYLKKNEQGKTIARIDISSDMKTHEFDDHLFAQLVEKLKAAGIITGTESDGE